MNLSFGVGPLLTRPAIWFSVGTYILYFRSTVPNGLLFPDEVVLDCVELICQSDRALVVAIV